MKISVLLSVLNGEKYLKEAIDSVLAQTFKDFELILIDDGSTDSTLKIIESYRSHKDGRIKLIRNEKNLGLTPSLNEGIDIAKGKYLARMDADDICFPTRFEKEVEYLDSHKEVGVIGTNFSLINYDGYKKKEYFDKNNVPLEWLLLFENPIANPSSMFRKSVIDKHNFRYNTKYAEDYSLWCRMALVTRFARLDDVIGITYRRRLDSFFHKNSKVQLQQAIDTNNEYIRSLGVEPMVFQEFLTRFNAKKVQISSVDKLGYFIKLKEALCSKIKYTNEEIDNIMNDIIKRL